MIIRWITESNKGGTIFYVDELPVVVVKAVPGCEDCFTLEDENVIRWERTTETPTNVMEMAVKTLFIPEHTMIPSVSYDGNPRGRNHEYKGYEWNGTPYTFAFHRCAVPGASCSMNKHVSFALYASQGEQCSCSLQLENDGAIHRVLWPEMEGPRVLHAGGHWEEAYFGTIDPRSKFIAYLCFGSGQNVAWKGMLRNAWKMNYCSGVPCLSPNEVWNRSIAYAKLLYTEEVKDFKAFSIGFTWNGNQWVKRCDIKYEIGGSGQSASLAVSLLYDYQMHNNKESLEMGLAVLDSWINCARSNEGFLLTRYHPNDSTYSLIDACSLGQAGLQFFKAYDISKCLGFEKPQFLETALEICRFTMKHQRLDGGIGVYWNPDGTPHELRGSSGASLILPLVEAFIHTRNPAYHVAAVRAFSYYYNEFKRNGYCATGALDDYCIDRNSAIPLLKGALLLYHSTGFPFYIDWAEEIAWYLSTWQWHHTVDYPEGTGLHKIKYNTFGGTAVSTSHHYINSYGLCYVTDLLELAKLTKNSHWRERALAIWNNGVQGISDGATILMEKDPRPIGTQYNGYLHTRWEDPATEEGRFSLLTDCLEAWPAAFLLEVLRSAYSWNLFY